MAISERIIKETAANTAVFFFPAIKHVFLKF